MQGSTTGITPSSVSGGNLPEVRFPGEDGGRSLAEMAQRDLDAALQLLADRAQYITGSSGAAIALRRHGKNDMLCRASSGENAPDLGALLSTEFGLSGESVRTRQLLRCDDAERDARVNREACRELGIASVVVMPVVNDDEVLGVFELFSGNANAFGERDFAALRRLSEMVETAVKLARVTEELPKRLHEETSIAPAQEETPAILAVEAEFEVEAAGPEAEKVTSNPAVEIAETPPRADPVVAEIPEQSAKTAAAAPMEAASSKPLLWSLALEARGESPVEEDQSHVPNTLRNLKKCEACGFPVSPGRALCVECEDKKWRGTLKLPKKSERPVDVATPNGRLGSTQSSASPALPESRSPKQSSALGPNPTSAVLAPGTKPVGFGPSGAAAAPALALEVPRHAVLPGTAIAALAAVEAKTEPLAANSSAAAPSVSEVKRAAAPNRTTEPELVLSAGLEPSQSWLARNKFLLIPLAAVAAAAAFLLLR